MNELERINENSNINPLAIDIINSNFKKIKESGAADGYEDILIKINNMQSEIDRQSTAINELDRVLKVAILTASALDVRVTALETAKP